MNTPEPGKNSQKYVTSFLSSLGSCLADRDSWYFTDDKRIAITGGNQCLDDSGSGLQTWQCTTGNTNQSESSRRLVSPFIGR